MGMMINNTDISVYHASLNNDLVISPATVTIYDDWLRKAPNPVYVGKQETFKAITFTAVIKDESDEAVDMDISNLANALEKCTAKFDNINRYFDCTLSKCDPERWATGVYQLSIELKSAYAYLPPVPVTLIAQSQTITTQGNLPSPAVVTLTPTQDIGAVTLTGLAKRPIIVKNLHAGAPVTIDGEACTVTEPDIETVLTEAQGANKWLMRKYSMAALANPDDTDIHLLPTKATIPTDQPYTQQLISDGADLYKGGGYDYLGYLKTAVQVSTAKTVTLHLYHDDGASVYLNGAQVYGHNYHCVADDGTGPATVTLNLIAGWNTVEIIWIQHYGPDGIYGVAPVLGTQVDALNCKHATPDSPGGVVNKFPDTDMWQFPALQPGDQTVTTDTPLGTVGVDIQYHPKFM